MILRSNIYNMYLIPVKLPQFHVFIRNYGSQVRRETENMKSAYKGNETKMIVTAYFYANKFVEKS